MNMSLVLMHDVLPDSKKITLKGKGQWQLTPGIDRTRQKTTRPLTCSAAASRERTCRSWRLLDCKHRVNAVDMVRQDIPSLLVCPSISMWVRVARGRVLLTL